MATPPSRRGINPVSFLESINPLALLSDARRFTPQEFLRDFYTRRGLYDKLKDVDVLVAVYGHQMHLLYQELDKKYVLGTRCWISDSFHSIATDMVHIFQRGHHRFTVKFARVSPSKRQRRPWPQLLHEVRPSRP